jgi:hypothetical protein
MYVSSQLQQIGLLLANDGFIPVLEKVAMALIVTPWRD